MLRLPDFSYNIFEQTFDQFKSTVKDKYQEEFDRWLGLRRDITEYIVFFIVSIIILLPMLALFALINHFVLGALTVVGCVLGVCISWKVMLYAERRLKTTVECIKNEFSWFSSVGYWTDVSADKIFSWMTGKKDPEQFRNYLNKAQSELTVIEKLKDCPCNKYYQGGAVIVDQRVLLENAPLLMNVNSSDKVYECSAEYSRAMNYMKEYITNISLLAS